MGTRSNYLKSKCEQHVGSRSNFLALTTFEKDRVRQRVLAHICLDADYVTLCPKWSLVDVGYIYILENPAWPGWVKVGKTVDVTQRLRMYQTGDPFRAFDMAYFASSAHQHSVEYAVHAKLINTAEDIKNEWFKIKLETAKNILLEVEEKICELRMK